MFALPLLMSAAAATASPAGGEIEWVQGPLTNAVGQASQKDALVMIYFWRNGSDHCAKLYQETLTHEKAVNAVGDMVCYSANYDDPQGGKLFTRFNVSTLPTILILGPDGKPKDVVSGYIGPDAFISELARIRRNEGTISGLTAAARAATKGSDEAIELHWKLAGKHQDLGDQETHDAVLAVLREEHDPQARTVIGARAHLWKVQSELEELFKEADTCGEACQEDECDHSATLAKVDITSLYTHVKRLKLAEARFEGWSTVANTEIRRGDRERAVKAFSRAFKDLPEEAAITWPKQVAWWVIEDREDASPREKKLALQMAELAVERARQLDPSSKAYGDSYGETRPEQVQVEALTTLAMALDVSGNRKKAVKVARQVLDMSASDEVREVLAPILEG